MSTAAFPGFGTFADAYTNLSPWEDSSGVMSMVENIDSTWPTLDNSFDPQLLGGNGLPCPAEARYCSPNNVPSITISDREYDSYAQGDDAESAIIRLAQLNENLAEQIGNLKSYTWTEKSNVQSCIKMTHEVKRNPIARALQSVAELATILEKAAFQSEQPAFTTMAHSVSGISGLSNEAERGDEPKATALCGRKNSNPGSRHLLSTPMMLLVLSSYLQIIEVYDSMYHRIRQAVENIPNVINVLRRSPNFQPFGLPPMKVELYIKIMTQMAEHHLGSIQNCLGIPTELLITSEPMLAPATLNNVHLSSLLSTMETQKTISLRANLRTVKQLLLH
ncbi:hypothetical protein LTR84_011301 [Exophiala bonariae]|uniref:Aflatoxin regulatory protein domain-containing protein n=1 Tax=Exophiala bonariae TaxID=1690606 RepID=A0AAV9MUV0_9EURO|nr:hypothetical protein LTR84_011301 [Exophiala bonariae]